MNEPKSITIEEAVEPGAESSDPAYLAWKRRKIEAALQEADVEPAGGLTHGQVFSEIRQKRRP